MKKAMKWGLAIVGLLVVLIVAAVIVVPMVVDVNQYKPKIEALVSEQTGRSFTMGDDIDLSVFPWVGVRLTDVALGNAKGFKAGQMVSVKSFEVRLKVMPLISRQIEIASFILDSPNIALEKNKAGTGNWENIGPAGGRTTPETPKNAPAAASARESSGLPIASLSVGRCAIVNGTLSYTDAATGMEKTVSDLNVELTDISLDKPVKLDVSALVDGQSISLSGSAGPIGSNPGKEDMAVDLALNALDTLSLTVKGSLLLAGKTPGVDAAIAVEAFSPRDLFEKLGQPFPIETSDSTVLTQVSLAAVIKGSAEAVTLSGGKLVLDDSTLTFTAGAKAFDKPDIRFDLSLDKIDADRYLPPKKEGGTGAKASEAAGGSKSSDASGTASSGAGSSGIDYAPLRKLVLDGKAAMGEFKVANLTMTHVTAHVTGKNGVFNLKPFSMDLYQGNSTLNARVDVRGKAPVSTVDLETTGVQAGPLVRDGAGKDIIEGALAADVNLTMTGDTPEGIKKTLGGKGGLTFTDGAIVGIDIAGTIRNATSGLGLSQGTSEKPSTDFAELKIPYTASQGLVTVPGASLVSPLLRLAVSGKTDLPSESLDFKVEPKLVATLKGQGDTQSRSGLLIPLLITGTWQAPKIRPDMEGLLKQKAADPEAIKSLIKGGSDSGESVEDKAKGLIKGLFN